MKTIVKTRVALVHGSAVTTIIQDLWHKKDLAKLVEICPGFTYDAALLWKEINYAI